MNAGAPWCYELAPLNILRSDAMRRHALDGGRPGAPPSNWQGLIDYPDSILRSGTLSIRVANARCRRPNGAVAGQPGRARSGRSRRPSCFSIPARLSSRCVLLRDVDQGTTDRVRERIARVIPADDHPAAAAVSKGDSLSRRRSNYPRIRSHRAETTWRRPFAWSST